MTLRKFKLPDLKLAPENPRGARSEESIAVMAESLAELGLLHSLVGYQAGDHVMIVSGGTRLAAIQALREAKRIKTTDDLYRAIPVTLTERDAACDAALASNEVAELMRPTDRFRAYRALHVEGGVSAADIAKRYFTDTAGVERILRLAGLADPIFAALDAGAISLDTAKVYAGCEDPARQVRVFEACGGSAHAARRALRENTYTADDPKAQLVGLPKYRMAGGEVEADLFADTTVLVNGEIVDQLLPEAIAEQSEAFLADGWAAVHFADGWQEADALAARFGERLWSKARLSKPAKAEVKPLKERLAELRKANGSHWPDAWDDRAAAREAESLEADISRIELAFTGWTKAERKTGTLIWSFGHGGDRFTLSAWAPKAVGSRTGDGETGEAPTGPDYPESFEMRVRRAAGVGLFASMANTAEAGNGKIARVGALLALRRALHGSSVQAKDRPEPKYDCGVVDRGRVMLRDIEAASWSDQPADIAEQIERLLALDGAQLDVELARAVGSTFDYGWTGDERRRATFEALSRHSEYDPAASWPFGKDEFKALTCAQLTRVLAEMGAPDVPGSAKKGDLVKLAAARAEETGWVPEFIQLEAGT